MGLHGDRWLQEDCNGGAIRPILRNDQYSMSSCLLSDSIMAACGGIMVLRKCQLLQVIVCHRMSF